MNEIDVLKSISENLVERKTTAALSNFVVLCNNIEFVNNLFEWAVGATAEINARVADTLKEDKNVKEEARDSSKVLFFYRAILPRVLHNGTNISFKFLLSTRPERRDGITVENVGELQKSFIDYNELNTSTRQFIDSLVSDSYQSVLLDSKSTNYHVLSSLSSFNKYATKSIEHALFNEQILKSLSEFDALTFHQRKNSHISKCDHSTFGEKVDFLFSTLSINGKDKLKDDLKNLFKFSSEFTHIGYISTMFTSTYESEVIFGDDKGPYLPSTENFNELKYQILETSIDFFVTVYLPSILSAIERLLLDSVFNLFRKELTEVINKVTAGLKSRNNIYYFFVRSGLIKSNEAIQLPCICGTVRDWKPPHNASDLFCEGCGSSFNLIEIEGDPGYIITSNGPIKVIGSNVPDLKDLHPEERRKLLEKVNELLAKKKEPE